MQLNIKADIKAAEKALGALKRQVPFAASVAINRTLADIRKVEQAAAKRELDRPRSTTIRGIRMAASTKRYLSGAVFIIPAINAFLALQVVGGTRPVRGREGEPLPAKIKLNQYGNIPGRKAGKIRKLHARPDTFRGVVGGVDGLWQRVGPERQQRLKLLLAYEPRVRYKPRFHFYRHAERTAALRWPRQFQRAISQALRTAR